MLFEKRMTLHKLCCPEVVSFTLSMTEESSRDVGCETCHQGRWLLWKSVLWYKENRSISLSGSVRKKIVINWKLLEVCSVGNNSQRGRDQYVVRKTSLKGMGYLLKVYATCIHQQYHKSVWICVFPTSKYSEPLLCTFICTEYPSPTIYHLFTYTYDNLL